jgi:D-sedoheptulose 7-phosphate isomerase
MGMKVIGLMGAGGGSLSGLCDVSIKVPSKSTPRIQEAHVTIIHALCGIIEEELCS